MLMPIRTEEIMSLTEFKRDTAKALVGDDITFRVVGYASYAEGAKAIKAANPVLRKACMLLPSRTAASERPLFWRDRALYTGH